MEIFKLFGSIFVNTDDAEKSIQKTSDKAESFASKLGSGIQTAAKWSAAVVTTASVAVGSMSNMAVSASSTADNIDKMSQKIGISREAYQEFDFICSQSGMSVDQLQSGMKKLTNVLADAQTAAREASAAEDELNARLEAGEITLDEYNAQYDKIYESAYDACGGLEQLGFSLEEISQMSPEDALYATLEALQAMPDDANRAALAQDLLGKSAQELAPLLNSGVGSIEEMQQKAHDLGLVLSDEVIDAGVSLTDTMDQMHRALSTIGTNIGASFMPILQDLCQMVIDNLPMIQTTIGNIAPVLSSAFESLLPPMMTLITSVLPIVVQLVNELLPTITEITNAILPIIVQLIETIVPPLVQIIQMIAPLIAELLPPLIGLLQPIISLLSPLIELVMVLLSPLIKLLNLILPPLIGVMTEIVQVIESVLQPAIEFLAKNIIGDNLNGALMSIIQVMSDVWDFLSMAWGWIQEKIGMVTSWIAENIAERFTLIHDTIVMVVTAISSKFGEALSGMWASTKNTVNWIIGGFEKMVNGVIKSINKILDGINTVVDGVGNLIGLDWEVPTLKEINLPRLKKGTVVNRPTIAEIGEDGTEAVVPLENNTQWIRRVAEELQLQTTGVGATALAADKADEILAKLEIIISVMMQYLPKLANMVLVTDTGALVGELAEAMNEELGIIASREDR